MDLQNRAVNIRDKGYEHPNCTICETFDETISRRWIPGVWMALSKIHGIGLAGLNNSVNLEYSQCVAFTRACKSTDVNAAELVCCYQILTTTRPRG